MLWKIGERQEFLYLGLKLQRRRGCEVGWKKTRKWWRKQKREGPVCCCCSVAKSCLTLCSPMNYSMPGFPVLHHFPEFVQTHVHWVSDAIQPSHPLSLLLLLPSIFPRIRVMSQLLVSGGQSIGPSSLASVLPMNIQGWFLLELTALISLQSKGLSRISSTTIWKHQFFGINSLDQPSLWSNSHICTWLLEKP